MNRREGRESVFVSRSEWRYDHRGCAGPAGAVEQPGWRQLTSCSGSKEGEEMGALVSECRYSFWCFFCLSDSKHMIIRLDDIPPAPTQYDGKTTMNWACLSAI